MQECNLWWRGKHSTAWAKQEILIVRPAQTSSDPTVSSRHQEFSIPGPNLVAGAQGRKCVCNVIQGHLSAQYGITPHTIICRELSLIKAKQASRMKNIECDDVQSLPLCSGRHPNSPGHSSSSPVSLSRTV